jgi:hypothetical protein
MTIMMTIVMIMTVENPPLWVWAVIVGIMIAGKFIYRWYATKQLAKTSQERKEMQNELDR